MILVDASRVLGLVVVVVGLVVIENVLWTIVYSASSQRRSGVLVVVDLKLGLRVAPIHIRPPRTTCAQVP